MAVNKVIYGSDTLIDLTADTVTADKLKEGETAHSADGVLITGTMSGGTVHTDTYTPAVNTSANDMGASHKYRYVNTSGMIKPSGTTSASYTTNGTSTVNVKNYENISITRNISAKLQNKTVTPTSSQQIITADSGYDGLSDVTIDAMKLQNKTVTPTSSQQIITADSGYDGLDKVTVEAGGTVHTDTYTPAVDTSANDMGASHKYRYVNTSGMIKPSGTKSVNYTTNGTSTVNVKDYENISIRRAVPLNTIRTKLWQNSNPDASFADQTVTLSQSIANFQYIEIEWQNRYSTVTTVTHYEPSVITRLADFRDSAPASDRPGIGMYYNHGGAAYCRRAHCVSDTQVRFTVAYRLATTGTSTGIIIPLKIYGLSFSV